MSDNLIHAVLADLNKNPLVQFKLLYPGLYLFGEPPLDESETDSSNIAYKTIAVSRSAIHKLQDTLTRDAQHAAAKKNGIAQEEKRFIFEIHKKTSSIFGGWVSVGRAKNNDIVLRFPTVSKLHAIFEVERKPDDEDEYEYDFFGGDEAEKATTSNKETHRPVFHLMDNNSTTQTVHNGAVLSKDKKAQVSVGDKILFGNVQCVVTDAVLLWQLLR